MHFFSFCEEVPFFDFSRLTLICNFMQRELKYSGGASSTNIVPPLKFPKVVPFRNLSYEDDGDCPWQYASHTNE